MKSADRKDKIVVVVGTVTNDLRVLNTPKLKVESKTYVTNSDYNILIFAIFISKIKVWRSNVISVF